MNIEEVRNYCLAKKAVTEEFPFDKTTLAFKVLGKIFLLTSIGNPDFSMNLKCEPEKAIALRSEYESIRPGYHMNKKHWNTVDVFKEELSDELIQSLIDHSYERVVAGMPKSKRVLIMD